MLNTLHTLERRGKPQQHWQPQDLGAFASRGRSRRRAEQWRRCLRAYEQSLLTSPEDPDRLHRLRCALEAVGRDTIDELNDCVSRRLSSPG